MQDAEREARRDCCTERYRLIIWERRVEYDTNARHPDPSLLSSALILLSS
eukprot:COSAG02_NODE_7166_length_3142_cov_1955.449228_1_plen_50_part_00